MIDFPCHHCGFQFSVPEDQAGGTIQCPTCHLLADVPTLSDLNALLPDGTYRMDRPEPTPPDALARTFHAFNRGTYDLDGNEKDLRLTIDDIRRVGTVDPAVEAHPLQKSPKYDPETGELIRPLPVVTREGDGVPIPLAKTALGYATPGTFHRINPLSVYLELLRPGNTIVMSFVLLFHLLAELMILTLSVLFPVVGFVVLSMAIIAHFGCVVEDIGREEKDELPRPLRDLNLADDLWHPFINVVSALLLCYGPAIFSLVELQPGTWARFFVTGSLTTLGTIMLPAVLLTQLTGGSIANLRPDRLFGLIQTAGNYYLILVVSYVIGFITYASGFLGLNYVATIGLLRMSSSVKRRYWVLSFFLLMAGIYLMHAFCWQLGLLYRSKNAQFPWIFQRHERPSRQENIALARAARQNRQRRGR